ncbi:hypothetical protein [Knoellia aerolata]|uniref:Uncharacterized protein n=1 Tax=Knoellia aerolata DSM 18566 TaxID=1385519 RepID=A0A0A0JU41_9MICO|nr:hypothetical protein [Knoellia aerolata]KGN40910.1 hypothetical protein N801_10640 [Knoellia aerolata DSM 18566]
MDLVDIVSSHAPDARPVFATAEAMALVARVPGAQPVPAARTASAVVVHRAASGSETGALTVLAELLGDHGIGVLVLDTALTSLPLGAVLRTLGEGRLRALAVHSMSSSGARAAVVVTRDLEVPLRSHVLGEPFPTSGPDASLRRDNELVVEAVVARAMRAELERRLRVAAEEERRLQAQVEQMRGELAAESKAVTQARAEVGRLERALVLVERRSPGYRAARLASAIRDDAVGAGRRLLDRWGPKRP